MLEETKVEFNLLYALRCGINSDNLPQIVKIFSEHQYLTPDSFFHGGSSTFHYACSMGAQECVNFFLKECKCNANSTNSQYGMAPVHMAAIHGKSLIISLLHEAGADFYQVDNEKENVIHKAVLTGDIDFIKDLLDTYRLECLLDCSDRNNNRPVKFLQDLVSKGLHPKQLSKDNEEQLLKDLIEYLHFRTQQYLAWKNRRYFLQIRAAVRNTII